MLRGDTGRLRESELPLNVCGEEQSSGGQARPRAESIAKGLMVQEPLSYLLGVDLPTRRTGLAAESGPLKKVNLPVDVFMGRRRRCFDQGMQLLSPKAKGTAFPGDVRGLSSRA